MGFTTFIAPIIEGITGLLTVFYTIHVNNSDQNFYIMSIFGILRKNGFRRFRLNLWYISYFLVIIVGVYYAFKNGPEDVTGSFLLKVMAAMTGLVIIYGLFLIAFKMDHWQKPRAKLTLVISIISELILVISLVIAWYVGYVMTSTLSAAYLKTLPEPLSGFYALIYVFSFIFLYFTVSFYIVSSSFRPALIWTTNAFIRNNSNFSLRLKLSKDQMLLIDWISNNGIGLEDKESLKIIPWKYMKSIEIIFENDQHHHRTGTP